MKKATDPKKKSAARAKPEHDTKRFSRRIRGLIALFGRYELSREELDRAAKVSNSPDVVMKLRRMGFVISIRMQPFSLPDGSVGHYGVYRLEPESRLAAMQLIEKAKKGGAS